jgi:SAM-dependent methyltransferase
MSGYHTAHLLPDPTRTLVWSVIAEHLSSLVPTAGSVLEIGAGYCDWINHVRAQRRVAVDAWPEFAKFAAPGVVPLVMDVAAGLPTLGASQFDLVLASNVLEHFEPDTTAAIVRDVHALLRPGGRFIAIQPNFRYAWKQYFDDYTHRSVFTDVSLPALMRAGGFDIERVEGRFLPYSMQRSRVRPRTWLVRAYLRSPIKPMAGQMLVIARRG